MATVARDVAAPRTMINAANDDLTGYYQTLVLTADILSLVWEEAVALRQRPRPTRDRDRDRDRRDRFPIAPITEPCLSVGCNCKATAKPR